MVVGGADRLLINFYSLLNCRFPCLNHKSEQSISLSSTPPAEAGDRAVCRACPHNPVHTGIVHGRWNYTLDFFSSIAIMAYITIFGEDPAYDRILLFLTVSSSAISVSAAGDKSHLKHFAKSKVLLALV
jgi:hypothetical protein